MPLLNYTTQVAAEKTAAEIQVILSKGKARAVATEYDGDGQPIGLAFQIHTPFGPREFTLPVNADAVYKVMCRDRVSPRFRTVEQAKRVAWRILKDWVEAQLAIVATQMVTLDQVMLPYLRTEDGTTVYDRYASQQLALEAGHA